MQLGQSLALAKTVTIDTETTYTKSNSDRRIIGVAVAVELELETLTYYIPVGHGEYLPGFDPENVEFPHDFWHPVGENVPVIMHNAKFDLIQLSQISNIEPLTKCLYDTMLMGHYINENQFLALDKMAEKYLGIRKEVDLAKAMKGTDWHNIPPAIMGEYAEQDVRVTQQLFWAQLPEFAIYEETWKYDRKFLLLLMEMEVKGIPINVSFCREQSDACENRMRQIRHELGFDPAKPSQLHPRLFSPPPTGLGLKPSSFTPTGKPQVNDDFLEAQPHPICALVLEYRKLGKARSAYYEAYLSHMDSDGAIHPTFKQQGTVTGRLSCADPNLQQIPREGNVKKAFLPEIGKQLWEIDYSAIEYRLAAAYSRDNDLIASLEAGADFHTIIANRLGIPRQQAKTVNFLMIYGGGVAKLAEQLKIPMAKAKKIWVDYQNEVSAIFNMMKNVNALAAEQNYIRLWSGRRRHFEYPSEARKAFNSLVQGGAFEIVKRSMLKLKEAGFDIRNQVHDSVWIMVDNEDEVKEAMKVMSDWTKETFGLTFTVDSKRLN